MGGLWVQHSITNLQPLSISQPCGKRRQRGRFSGQMMTRHNTTVQWCTKYVRNMYEVHRSTPSKCKGNATALRVCRRLWICSRSGPRKCQAFHSVMIFRRHSRCLPGVFAKKFLRTTWPGCAAGCCEQTPWASQTCLSSLNLHHVHIFSDKHRQMRCFCIFLLFFSIFPSLQNLRWVPFLPGCSLFQGGPFLHWCELFGLTSAEEFHHEE